MQYAKGVSVEPLYPPLHCTVDPWPSTQSPVKIAFSSSSNREKWSSVWPGVVITLSVAPTEIFDKVSYYVKYIPSVEILSPSLRNVKVGSKESGIFSGWSAFTLETFGGWLRRGNTPSNPPIWSWCLCVINTWWMPVLCCCRVSLNKLTYSGLLASPVSTRIRL